MYKPALTLAIALALVAGCATHPEPSPNWVIMPAPQLPIEPAPEKPSLLPELQLVPVPPPAPVPPAPLVRDGDWVSLNVWTAQNQLAAPRPLSSSPMETYAITTPNGELVVQVGSIAATWNRVAVRLGFAPRIKGNQLWLNVLDVQKNLEPLARGGPPRPGPNRVIVLDPGHGGSNPGTRSAVDGRNEKDLTLDWAQRLAPLLEQQGWRVYLTRTNDVDVGLLDRVAFANALNADLFVSLHFNASPASSEPAGVETYCLTPAGMVSSVTRNYSDDARQVYPNNTFDAENLQYAVRLHRALLEIPGLTDRGVRRARYQTVLPGQNRPAVLIEGGYLSNPREARRIADPQYRQKLAEALAKALE